jgi:alanine racemase
MALQAEPSPVRDEESVQSTVEILTGGPPEPETGGVLTIDLAAMQANFRNLCARVTPVECAAVIKADAYGCGIEPVATALAQCGCKTFFVAHLAEARRVRDAAPDATVYALSGLPPGSAAAFADAGVRPVIGTLSELAEWDAFCGAQNWRGGAALHFDTGMNRLGLGVDEAAALAQRINKPDHGITLVMSHFACADTPNLPLNERQVQLFREIRAMFRGITASLANSSGIFLGPAAHFDMVRPGYALYGGNPTPSEKNPMHAVVEVKARVVQVRTVARGETVGYGATWAAPRTARVAIISAGYADGYLRAAGDTGAEILAAGARCRLVGRVSMDLMAADISALPEQAVRRGDYVTLIGGDIGIDALAAQSGTIGYEVLSNLGRRFTRVWRR